MTFPTDIITNLSKHPGTRLARGLEILMAQPPTAPSPLLIAVAEKILNSRPQGASSDPLTKDPVSPPNPARKPRKPTLASVTKQARKAGIDPSRIEIRSDGTVIVVTGAPEQQQGNEVDDWIAKHADKTQRH
jgi:hypothetical protein